MTSNVKADVLQVFSTDIQQIDWSNSGLNQDLKNKLWKKRALDPEGVYRSNRSGTWHSKDDVLTTTGKAGEELGEMFHASFLKYAGTFATKPGQLTLKLAAWAMMYSHGGYATVHTHPNCHFSGVSTWTQVLKYKRRPWRQGSKYSPVPLSSLIHVEQGHSRFQG